MVNILSGVYPRANTLTGLIPDLFEGLDVVSRELVGFIPSVSRDFSAERAAVGESITYPISPAMTSSDISPAMTIPEPTDRTVGYGSMTINKSKFSEFGLTGEEMRGLNNGIGSGNIQADLFAQALRVLVNEIESDIATAAYLGASRAYGTPGVTPFASNVGDLAQVRKILDDNGAPTTGRALVMDTSAGAALRTLTNLTKVNEAGTTMTLRDGELLNIHGFSLKESAQVKTFTAGTGASATTDDSGYAVGATSITLAAAGTGTILAGDYITFAGDTNKYLVVTGAAAVSGATIEIAKPGLRKAIGTSATAITVVKHDSTLDSVRNIAFTPDAIKLVTRAPALPNGQDSAVDSMMLTDPRSGLTFEVRIYYGYRKMRAEVALAWGTEVIKKQHVAALLG